MTPPNIPPSGQPDPAALLALGLATQAADAGASSAPPPTPAELAAEFPRLDILELLGRGGMGAVYKARQRDLDRLVALKILRPGLDADPGFAERFTREARSLAQLNHPGIVTLYEFGKTSAGRYFILMEFVDGTTLRQLLAGGRLSSREALAIVPPLCDALQYAHDRGLVHRDIKPENILIDRLGRVKIADFGLAKLTTRAEPADTAPTQGVSAPDLSEAGKVMGTPRYMAPEQRTRPTEVDHRADIYALGVVLYQMLTGELPDAKQLRPPSHRVQIDVRLDEIVLRALEKDPALRYAAASEFKTRIETVASNPTPPPPPAPPVPPSPASASDGAFPAPRAPANIKAPAIAMLVVGIVDLLGLLFGLLIGVFALLAMPVVAGIGIAHFNTFGGVFPMVGALAGLAIILVVGWLLFHTVAAIYVITAARRMLSLHRHRSACAGAVVLIVIGAMGICFSTVSAAHAFTALWSLVELGVGIWALVVLRQPDAKAAFDHAPDSAFPSRSPSAAPAQPVGLVPPARQVSAPAVGLMVVSGLHLLLCGAALPLLFLARLRHTGAPWGPTPIPAFCILLLILLLVAVPAILTFIAGWRMRRLRGHGFAVAGAILAIVTGQGMPLGLVFGIWALVVLTRRDVRAAFDQDKPRSGAGGCLLAGGVMALALLLASAIVIGGFFFTQQRSVSTTRTLIVRPTVPPPPSLPLPLPRSQSRPTMPISAPCPKASSTSLRSGPGDSPPRSRRKNASACASCAVATSGTDCPSSSADNSRSPVKK